MKKVYNYCQDADGVLITLKSDSDKDITFLIPTKFEKTTLLSYLINGRCYKNKLKNKKVKNQNTFRR